MSWKLKRLTVEAPMVPPLEPHRPGCDHEITWFTTEEKVERCAICGETLGLWTKRTP